MSNSNYLDSTAPGSNSLRADISKANADANSMDIIDLQAGQTYQLLLPNPATGHETANRGGDLNIANTNASVPVKTYIFIGLGTGATIEQTLPDRVFEIGSPGAPTNVKVEFQNVTIEHGRAQDNGSNNVLPGATDAEGGGILAFLGSNPNDGLNFTSAHVIDDRAVGAAGYLTVPKSKTAGTSSHAALPGTDSTNSRVAAGNGAIGVNGRNAYGGGLYSTAGTITISKSVFSNDQATGGSGQDGGHGGNVGNNSHQGAGPGGDGGNGGNGGNASGGAIYAAAGNVMVQNGSIIDHNIVLPGYGGYGGNGGNVVARAGGVGGTGGNGGNGGNSGSGFGAGSIRARATSPS
jgi:hypothetical protein